MTVVMNNYVCSDHADLYSVQVYNRARGEGYSIPNLTWPQAKRAAYLASYEEVPRKRGGHTRRVRGNVVAIKQGVAGEAREVVRYSHGKLATPPVVYVMDAATSKALAEEADAAEERLLKRLEADHEAIKKAKRSAAAKKAAATRKANRARKALEASK